VFFADGSKRERLTLAVSAAGTSMRHRARLISRGGMSAQAFTVRATVFENGIFRCARACTIGVAGVTQRSGAAKAKRATKKKSPAKTPARRKRR
jgi:hypothetical protein